MMKDEKQLKIAIINGPNINLLGKREPEIYGRTTWKEIEDGLKIQAEQLGLELIFFQSNHEGYIVDFIQENLDTLDGVVINPAAFTKNGYSILDALTAVDLPYIEVHLSNILSRGGWHAETIFAKNSIGHINGLQADVYGLGLLGLYQYLVKKK